MAALLDQLRQLHSDLKSLDDRDPDQEVRGSVTLSLVDAVITEARHNLPKGSTLGNHVVELVSAESVEDQETFRVADVLLILGQLLAVYENEESKKPNASVHVPRG